eukprot:1116505-Pyramimonas_sp.AAC.1
MDLIKADAKQALAAAFSMFVPKTEVRVMFQTGAKVLPPSVVAKRSYDKGQLILVGLSMHVGIAAKLPASAVELRGVDGLPEQMYCYVMPYAATSVKLGGPDETTKSFVVPFWCAPVATESHPANMSLCALSIRWQPVEIMGRGKSSNKEFSVPALFNTKAIKEGENLYKSADSSKRDASASSAAGSSKKQKHS